MAECKICKKPTPAYWCQPEPQQNLCGPIPVCEDCMWNWLAGEPVTLPEWVKAQEEDLAWQTEQQAKERF